MTKESRRPPTRMVRTIRSLGFMVALGGLLIGLNAYTIRRDVGLATSSPGESQHSFFVDCAARPDMANFFKSLSPDVRLKMSQNIGQYDDPKMAALLGTLLGDFDVRARQALTDSMVKLAKTQPLAVAEQLKQKGSFQQIAITKALSEAGVDVAPMVANQLSVADARPNAVSFLVQVGQPAVNALMPMLDNKDKDVRLAAADALGKIRARNAVDKLLTMLESAKQKSASPDEYPALLAALAGIGDPKTEPILTSVLLDESIPVPMRSTAALGLGRISTPSSVTTDWKYANDADLQLRQSVVSGLRVAGDLALRMHQSLDSALVEVASGISSPSADQALVRAINNPTLESQAVRACANRPSVVPALRAKLLTLDVDSNGELATLLIETLRTTKSGNAVVESVRSKPEYLGLLAR